MRAALGPMLRLTATVPLLDLRTPLGPVIQAIPGAFAFLRCGEPLSDQRLTPFTRIACDTP
jgi:hypothetical protein